ncbi:MAG: DNA-3-methyladenine glycosylase [Planctomycetota bacterium]
MRLDRAFFARRTTVVARALVGQTLVRVEDNGARTAGRIVETEAYLGPEDRAAHTHGYRHTPRNHAIWMHPGAAYVFFTYGMHHCFNVSTLAEGKPQAVLVRALEPVEGLDRMRQRRSKARRDTDLCSGPAKLCQALGINLTHDRLDLTRSPHLWIARTRRRAHPASRIAAGPRVGVDYAGDWAARPLRYCLHGSPHVSPPRPG